MGNLPSQIKRALEKLRLKRKRAVVIRKIKKGYYAYESSTTYDRVSHKRKSVSFYIGKIDREGDFHEAEKRYKQETNVGSLNELMEARKELESRGSLDVLIHPSEMDLKILKLISADGRISASEIGKAVGLSRNAAERGLKRLEAIYGIKYVLDFTPHSFGLFRSCMFVKFDNKMPDVAEIKDTLSKYPLVQAVVLIKGDYDLFLYLLSENTTELENMTYRIMSEETFAKYDSKWYTSYITGGLGGVPFREEFFDFLKQRVWHRTKETMHKTENQLLEREYLVLKTLNSDGRRDFKDIDRLGNFPVGTSSYTFYKLLKKNMIRRVTINMKNPQTKYTALLYMEQINMSVFNSNRIRFLEYVIEDTITPTNRFVFEGDVSTPRGILFVAPIFENEDLNSLQEGLEIAVGHNVGIKSYVVTNVILGSFEFNKIDKAYSNQYKIIQDSLKK
jgi:Lrp/AsnC family leucine-responsive transcriptional regulator